MNNSNISDVTLRSIWSLKVCLKQKLLHAGEHYVQNATWLHVHGAFQLSTDISYAVACLLFLLPPSPFFILAVSNFSSLLQRQQISILAMVWSQVVRLVHWPGGLTMSSMFPMWWQCFSYASCCQYASWRFAITKLYGSLRGLEMVAVKKTWNGPTKKISPRYEIIVFSTV